MAAYQVGVPRFSLFEKGLKKRRCRRAFGTEDSEERETLNTPRAVAKFAGRRFGKLFPADDGLRLRRKISRDPPTAGEEREWYPGRCDSASVWSTDVAEAQRFS